MFPSNPSEYPRFVADQILTADNLQDLFNYLDEQERLTRVNLIGIGIVCGLELTIDPNGSWIKISKGVGVTSMGYHVALPDTTYTFYNDEFSAEKEKYYDRFVDGAQKQKFPLWELEEAGSPDAKVPLSKAFLADKIVLIFVELLEIDHKNCDPDSCDDTGVTITVNLRPLLVEEKNVGGLIGIGDSIFEAHPDCTKWPELRMRRYNVPATVLPNSAAILKGFLDLTDENTIATIENTLSKTYSALKVIVSDVLPDDPFNGLKNNLSFLYDGSLSLVQLIHIQYYYDFLYDLIQAYDELRCLCNKCLTLCCPDDSLFPRHLLLGPAFVTSKEYRHHFIAAPTNECCCGARTELRMFLLRLARMVKSLRVPPPLADYRKAKNPVRITPSKWGDYPLSQKAIPYYYDVVETPFPLYKFWRRDDCHNNGGKGNLGYHAVKYNNSDAHVYSPLYFELEPYNFFRIEGHIGMPWQTAFKHINDLKQSMRLPFDVVVMNGDFSAVIQLLAANIKNLSVILQEHPEKWKQLMCYFGDLELEYDMLIAEIRCIMAKAMYFLYAVDVSFDSTLPDNKVPVSGLIQQKYPQYRTEKGTLGHRFDLFYPTVKDKPYLQIDSIAASMGFAATHMRTVDPIYLMYYLEKVHEILPGGIIQLDVFEAARRMNDLVQVASVLFNMVLKGSDDNALGQDYLLHLNAIVKTCKGAALYELYKNFLFKFYWYIANQSFALYSFLNSGVDHKAGVPKGGTFILVYRDASIRESGFVEREDINIASTANETFTASVGASAGASIHRTNLSASGERISISEGTATEKINLGRTESLKESGMTYINKIIAERAKATPVTDKDLLELVNEIPDNTVIADFYLPFVCKSDCASMNFIVLGDRETSPGEIALEIDPREFCVNDERTYPVKVKPADGTLEGEGTSATDGGFGFAPAAVQIGNADSKSVTLTYKAGDDTATTSLVVFAMPEIAFEITPAEGSLRVTFKSISKRAASTFWDLGDGNTSESTGFEHTYKEFGRYEGKLVVRNGPCEASEPFSLELKERVISEARCAPLSTWRDAMVALDRTGNNDAFEAFKAAFNGYGEMREQLIVIVSQLLTLPVEDQVAKLNGTFPPATIMQLLKMLQEILAGRQTALHPFAMEAYRILVGVLIWYSCVQPDDYTKAEVKTRNAFALVIEQMATWGSLNLGRTVQTVLKALLEMVRKEHENTKANAPHKVNYIEALDKILSMF